MPRNKLQPCFTSLTETSLHEPLTDHKIVRAALGTVTVRSTVGSTVRTLEVLTESPDTFFWRVPYAHAHTNIPTRAYFLSNSFHSNDRKYMLRYGQITVRYVNFLLTSTVL